MSEMKITIEIPDFETEGFSERDPVNHTFLSNLEREVTKHVSEVIVNMMSRRIDSIERKANKMYDECEAKIDIAIGRIVDDFNSRVNDHVKQITES